MYCVWSTVYLGYDVEDYNCYVNENAWKRITNEIPTNRMFARLIKNDKFWVCALGPPIRTQLDTLDSIFVPQWMLDQINSNGDGEELEVEWLPSEVFDESTKIVLQPHDNEFHCVEIEDILSYELTKLAVLQKDTTIKVKIQEVDVQFIVKSIEPASVVMCQGDEVTLEFEESIDTLTRVPTPYPFDEIPTPLIPSVPSAPILEEVVEQQMPRFNPWRNKDFKPNVS